MPPRRMNQAAIEKLIVDRVAKAIAQHEANRATTAEAGAVGPAGAEAGVAGLARGVEGGNVASEVYGCTYKSFLNCNPHIFNVIEGAMGLSIWFEKLKSVF
ncbi:hypothetical protein Tco_1373335 [Tanacetum coccineum]